MGKALTIIAAGIFFLLKIVYWILKLIVSVLADIFIFFGLYIPALFLIFGVVLTKFTDFSFTSLDTNLNLYVVGLGLCVLCAVIITIRNLIIRPFKIVFGKTKEKTKKTLADRPKFKREDKEDRRRVEEKSFDKRQDEKSFDEKDKREESIDNEREERPLIYRSEIYPEIIVHEYEDRFDLYKEVDGYGKKFFRTEYKEQEKSKSKKSRKKSK